MRVVEVFIAFNAN